MDPGELEQCSCLGRRHKLQSGVDDQQCSLGIILHSCQSALAASYSILLQAYHTLALPGTAHTINYHSFGHTSICNHISANNSESLGTTNLRPASLVTSR